MAIQNSAVTNTGDDIFICPGTVSTDVQEHAVTCMMFCNIGPNTVELDVWAVPHGSPVSSSFGSPNSVPNQIIKSLGIPASETFTFDTEKLVLTTGDKIVASVGPMQDNRLVATVSSMRVS